MRVLFIKPALVWPRNSGHEIYCYFMMKGLVELGADVGLATVSPADPRALEGTTLALCEQLSEDVDPSAPPVKLTRVQERFRSFWGVSIGQIQSVRRLATTFKADVVVAFGLPALPYLAAVDGPLRVWAMADEWVYHHLTQVRLTDRTSWHHVKSALIKGAYERAYAPLVDRIWAVSDTDQRAAKWLAGMPVGDLLPLGVDTDFFHPVDVPEIPESVVFWGRLDFEPNIDALVWFCRHVWPEIARRRTSATFTIIGYQPTPEVERLATLPGVTLRPNVPDLRATVCEHALVVLPMVSGGGIKNKLLEGAAMGRPIVCTPRACMDLRSSGTLPLAIVRRPEEWVERVIELWGDAAKRVELGRQARTWVGEYYSWAIPARNALDAFTRAVAKR